MDYVKFSETSGLPTVELDASEESIAMLRRVRPIRIGAYTVDVTTNVIRWRGETLRLSLGQPANAARAASACGPDSEL